MKTTIYKTLAFMLTALALAGCEDDDKKPEATEAPAPVASAPKKPEEPQKPEESKPPENVDIVGTWKIVDSDNPVIFWIQPGSIFEFKANGSLSISNRAVGEYGIGQYKVSGDVIEGSGVIQSGDPTSFRFTITGNTFTGEVRDQSFSISTTVHAEKLSEPSQD